MSHTWSVETTSNPKNKNIMASDVDLLKIDNMSISSLLMMAIYCGNLSVEIFWYYHRKKITKTCLSLKNVFCHKQFYLKVPLFQMVLTSIFWLEIWLSEVTSLKYFDEHTVLEPAHNQSYWNDTPYNKLFKTSHFKRMTS